MGSNDLGRVNMGEDGLNTANTVFERYETKEKFDKAVHTAYGSDFNNKEVQYDHSTPKVAHDNQQTSYDKGAVVASSTTFHKAKTNARTQQEDFDLNSGQELYQPKSPHDAASILIANDSTLIDLSHRREMLDLGVVKEMPLNDLERMCITREDTFHSTMLSHALDRVQIDNVRKAQGFETRSEQYNFNQVRNVSKICTHCNKELSLILVNLSPEQITSPAFQQTLLKVLSYNKSAIRFHASIGSLYDPMSEVRRAVRYEENGVNQSLRPVVRILEQTNALDILSRSSHISSQEGFYGVQGMDLKQFGSDVLDCRPCSQQELCRTKEEMDNLSSHLKGNSIYRGRHRVLPSTTELDKQVSLPSTSFTSKKANPSFLFDPPLVHSHEMLLGPSSAVSEDQTTSDVWQEGGTSTVSE